MGLRAEAPSLISRPVTRGDCAAVSRPCPFVSCRYSLALDVSTAVPYDANGYVRRGQANGLKVHHAYDDGDPAPVESCALDVADRGVHTLEEVGAVMGCTRERARQIEETARKKLRPVVAAAMLSHEDFATPGFVDTSPDGDGDGWPSREDAARAKVPGSRPVHFATGGFKADRDSGVRLKGGDE